MWHFVPDGDQLAALAAKTLQQSATGEQGDLSAFETRIAARLAETASREASAFVERNGHVNDALTDFLGAQGSTDALITRLSEGIRAGKYKVENRELVRVLALLARERLLVDNPRYAALKE